MKMFQVNHHQRKQKHKNKQGIFIPHQSIVVIMAKTKAMTQISVGFSILSRSHSPIPIKSKVSQTMLLERIDLLAKQEKTSPLEIASMKMEQCKKVKSLLTENKEKKAEKEQLAIEETEEIEVSSSEESKSSCDKMELDKPTPRKGWKKSTGVPKGKEQTNPLPILEKKKHCIVEEKEEDNHNKTTDIPEEEIAHRKLAAEAQEKL